MGFVPVQGTATWCPGSLPRDAEIEFSGPRRTIRLPLRGAIPVLTRAVRGEDSHPSVRLLGGATLLALQLIAAGEVRLAESGQSWRVGPLRPHDEDRVRELARSRAYDGTGPEAATELIREVLDAVADTMTRTPNVPPQRPAAPRPGAASSAPRRVVPSRPRVDAVVVSLRIEAPEEVLASGGVVVVPQVHDATDNARLIDAEELWLEVEHGFSATARAAASRALRGAAKAWPVLDRLLRRPVPDRLRLEPEELDDLLQDGLSALADRGVEVYWPRGLRGDFSTTARVDAARPQAPREEKLATGRFGPDALFEFDWQVALDGDGLSAQEMDELAEATTPVIRLRDQWVVVDPEVAKRARARAGARGHRSVTPMAALQAALTGVIEVDGTAVEVHAGASLERLRERIVDASVVAPLPAPPRLRATLREYQRVGLTWLAELTGVGVGACLADDMGLGKTITLISLHLHRRDRRLATGPTLVVCPASLMGNWEAEIRRFAPGTAVRRFHGSTRDLSEVHDDEFVLTTYGTMRRDHQSLGAVAWDLVVADEAQHVKNAASATARHLRTIRSTCRVALTGTPVENDLTELWAILDWATPGLLGSRNAFRKTWAAPIEGGTDPAVARRFAQLVAPFLLRRRKSDPGIAPELPPKTETDQLVRLTREQAVLYEALVRDSMRRIEEADEDSRRGLVLALLTGLKQICNHPAHYLHQAHGRLRGRSEKLELLDELLGTILAEDGAVLVFTQYVEMARLLERHLAAAGVPTLFLHGGTPIPQRERMVRDFQDGAAPVFLLSLKAGGTGLNLTRADHVIHYDRWWNPAVEDQATDRAYRIGQTRAVQVHRLVTEGTIEAKVGELLTSKRDLAESVLGTGEVAMTELSNAELRDLVRLRTPHG